RPRSPRWSTCLQRSLPVWSRPMPARPKTRPPDATKGWSQVKNQRNNVMADLQKIVSDLSGLTVLEAAELAKLLEEKWGVSAAAAVAVAAGPAAGGAAAAPAEA